MAPRPFPAWARLHLKVQAVSAVALGLGLIFLPPQYTLYNPLTNFVSDKILHRSLAPLALHANANSTAESLALAGVFSFAIGTAYLIAFYHRYEEWLYMSIPARLIVSLTGVLVYVMAPKKLSPLVFVICAWDGIWAVALAFAVGSIGGKVPSGYGVRRKEQ